jgi:putative ABC transport system ATP-binding protein
MSILITENLSKTYGSGPTAVKALKPAGIRVEAGEFVAVAGASGSGKSTLLHLLGGLESPSGGRVILDGSDLYSLKEEELAVLRRRKIGFVFQFYNLIPVLTAEENITLPLILDNKPVDRGYIDELIHLLGLEQRRRHLPGALSGGQQQRVSIARALANKPSIILADEPTGNLDNKSSREVLSLLRLSVQKFRQTLLMVTHDTQVAAVADRIIKVEDGVVSSGRVEK